MVKIQREIELPTPANFLRIQGGKESNTVDVADLDVAEASVIADAIRDAFMENWAKRSGEKKARAKAPAPKPDLHVSGFGGKSSRHGGK